MPDTPPLALSKPFAKANPEIETLASYAQAPPESYWQKWPKVENALLPTSLHSGKPEWP